MKLDYESKSPADSSVVEALCKVGIVLACTSAAPAVAGLIAIYGSFIEARLRLGYWPRYGAPDPTTIIWPEVWTVVIMIALPVVAIGLAYLIRLILRRNPVPGLVIAIGSSVAMWGFVWVDPFGALNWLAD